MAFFEGFARGFLGASAEIGRQQIAEESELRMAREKAKINRKNAEELEKQRGEIQSTNRLKELEKKDELERSQKALENLNWSRALQGLPALRTLPEQESGAGSRREGLKMEMEKMAPSSSTPLEEGDFLDISRVDSTVPLDTPIPTQPRGGITPYIPDSLPDAYKSDLQQAYAERQKAEDLLGVAPANQAKRLLDKMDTLDTRINGLLEDGRGQAAEEATKLPKEIDTAYLKSWKDAPPNQTYNIDPFQAVKQHGGIDEFNKAKQAAFKNMDSGSEIAKEKLSLVDELITKAGGTETGSAGDIIFSRIPIVRDIYARISGADYERLTQGLSETLLMARFSESGEKTQVGSQSNFDMELLRGSVPGVNSSPEAIADYLFGSKAALERSRQGRREYKEFISGAGVLNEQTFTDNWNEYTDNFPLLEAYKLPNGKEMPVHTVRDGDVPMVPSYDTYLRLKKEFQGASPKIIKKIWQTPSNKGGMSTEEREEYL